MKKAEDTKNTIAQTALTLAEKDGWENFSVNTLQRESGLSAPLFRATVKCKNDVFRIVCEYLNGGAVDNSEETYSGMDIKDILFDKILMVFEKLNPHKNAVISMEKTVLKNPEYLLSVRSFLPEIPVKSGAKKGRKSGKNTFFSRDRLALCILFAYIYRVWRKDSSPGLDKTMTALDKALDILLNKMRHKTA